MKKRGFFQEYIFQIIRKRFKFEIHRRFFKRCFDLIISIDGDFFEWCIFSVGFRVRVSSAVIAMNSSNSAKISSSKRVLERITKKRTKNKAKTTKLDSEWKRL
ncbi:hypothetical protein Tco_0869392 [Tanacetum coccineum]